MSEKSDFKPSIAHRIAGLDELRGIAILVVMFAHFFEFRQLSPNLKHCHLGAWGVDVFFIISGFLIGKILLSADRNDHFFRRFYVRRLFRIAPLYIVMVVMIVVACIIFKQNYDSWIFYTTFTQNLIPEDEHLGDIVSSSYETLPTLAPMWSLAVEEHFYALMPMLIFLLPRHALKLTLFGAALVGIALKHYVTLEITKTSSIAYTNPFETWFRMQYLAFGVLLNFSDYRRLMIACAGFWLILIVSTGGWSALWELALCGFALFFTTTAIENKLVIKSNLLAWMGLHCFGLYLLHTPIQVIVRVVSVSLKEYVGVVPDAVWFVPFMMISVVAAHLSFEYFELPVQRLRTRFEGQALKV